MTSPANGLVPSGHMPSVHRSPKGSFNGQDVIVISLCSYDMKDRSPLKSTCTGMRVTCSQSPSIAYSDTNHLIIK